MNLELIPIGALDANVHNVRRNLGDLSELADSIKAVGVLQPLTVAPRGDFFESRRYVIIAGHRRHAAAEQAGLTTLPCVIRPDLTLEVDQLEAMLVENLQRADLTPLEEAVAYEQLELLGVKPGQIAKRTGRSAQTVTGRLGLMRLPESMRDKLADGQMTLAVAELATKYSDDPEILEAIERHNTVNRWAIDLILNRRKRERDEAERKAKALAAGETTEEDEDTDEVYDPSFDEDYAEVAAQRQQERQHLALIRETAKTVRQQWIREEIAAGSTKFFAGLARMALDTAADEWDTDRALEAFGVTPPTDDDDLDDYRLQRAHIFDTWSELQQLHALAVLVADVLSASTEYSYPMHLVSELRDRCGYEPAEEELELLAGE